MRPWRMRFLVSSIPGADSARAQEVPRKPVSSPKLWLPDLMCLHSAGGRQWRCPPLCPCE